MCMPNVDDEYGVLQGAEWKWHANHVVVDTKSVGRGVVKVRLDRGFGEVQVVVAGRMLFLVGKRPS